MESERHKEMYVVDTVSSSLSRVLTITDEKGTTTLCIYGHGLLCEKTGDIYAYHHYNHLGSTMKLTDAKGGVTASFTYGTYGELLSGSTGYTRFLYNGRCGVMTDDNGLYYMRQRYYSPELKRFVNQDVVRGSLSNSQSLNRYSYVQGNPVSYTDPFGLSPLGGMFEGTTWVHCLYGLLGFVPGWIGIAANLADAIVYAFVDHDYLMAGISVAACFTMGASKFAGYAIKTGKYAKAGQTALQIAKYSERIWAGLSFVKGADNMTDHLYELYVKYTSGEQKLGFHTYLELKQLLAESVLCGLSASGMVKSSQEILNLEAMLASKVVKERVL